MRIRMKTYKLWLLFLLASLSGINGCREESIEPIIEKTVTTPINISLTPKECQFDTLEQAKETEGQRKVALVIGISSFLSKNINPLSYTTKDARAFRDMLINDYGYPPENVCLLTDQEATIVNVRKYFQKMTALIKEMPASIPDEKKDVAVFYMSSHGSQVNNHPDDQNGADHEITGKDSTMLLYDSWMNGNWDLVDDEMYGMLGGLLEKTPNISVILDTCHSGSSIRSIGGNIKAIKEAERPEGFRQSIPSNHKTLEDIVRNKLVYLGAAQDDEFALELNELQHGVFTEALLRIGKVVDNTPLTYGKIKARIEDDMRLKRRSQTPVLEGPDGMVAFGTSNRKLPPNRLTVKQVGSTIRLTGTPLPGLGKGAIFNVFDENITAHESLYAKRVKTQLLILESFDDGQVIAEIIKGTEKESESIGIGDVAVMFKPSDSYEALRVRLTNGLSPNLVKELRSKIEGMSSGADLRLLEAADTNPEFIVEYGSDSVGSGGKRDVLIRSSSDTQRSFSVPQASNDQDTVTDIFGKLEKLNVQKLYINLQGQNGGVFEDNNTLQVRFVKSADPLPDANKESIEKQGIKCSDPETLEPITKDKGVYHIPVCTYYRVQVTYNAPKTTEEKPLHIGLVILGASGDTYGYPKRDALEAKLKPGETLYFPLGSTGFAAEPMLGHELFVVVGTQDKRNWDDVGSQGKDPKEGEKNDIDLTPWTLTKVPALSFDPDAKTTDKAILEH